MVAEYKFSAIQNFTRARQVLYRVRQNNDTDTSAGSVIRLAIDADVPELLPAAMYQAACYVTPSLGEESWLIRGVTLDGLASTISKPVVNMSLLTASETLQLFRGKMRLHAAVSYILINTVANNIDKLLTPDCDNKESYEDEECPCSDPLKHWLIKYVADDAQEALFIDPLTKLFKMKTELATQDSSWFKTCTSCRRDLGTALDAVREYLWGSLPFWFGLKPYSAGHVSVRDFALPGTEY